MSELPKVYEKLCNMRTKGFHVLLESDPNPGKNFFGKVLPPSEIKQFIAVSNTLADPIIAIQKLKGNTAFIVTENFSLSESAEKVFTDIKRYVDGSAVNYIETIACEDEDVAALLATQQFVTDNLTQNNDDPRNLKHDWVSALNEITQLFAMHYTHKISLDDIAAYCELPLTVTKVKRRL